MVGHAIRFHDSDITTLVRCVIVDGIQQNLDVASPLLHYRTTISVPLQFLLGKAQSVNPCPPVLVPLLPYLREHDSHSQSVTAPNVLNLIEPCNDESVNGLGRDIVLPSLLAFQTGTLDKHSDSSNSVAKFGRHYEIMHLRCEHSASEVGPFFRDDVLSSVAPTLICRAAVQ